MWKRKKVITYPRPPKSGLKGLLEVRSSRAWHDWWNALSDKQRNQVLVDQIHGVTNYET